MGNIYSGRHDELKHLPIQYADFAKWQQDQFESARTNQALQYWIKQLKHAPPLLELPTDFRRPAILDFEGETLRAQIKPALFQKLQNITRPENATPFMVLLSVFKLLMQRYAGQDDVVVGTPMVSRNHVELENLIGFFLNNLAIRTNLSGNPTFRELIGRVRKTTLGAYSHQNVPFEKIVQELDPPRDLSHTPIFQVFFNMTTEQEQRALDLTGLEVEPYISADTDAQSKFDLTLYLNQKKTHIDLRLVYKTSLFKRERMEQLLDQYLHVLDHLLSAPNTPTNEVSLLTESSQPLLPDPASPLDSAWNGPVHAALTRQAAKLPDKIAIIDPNEQFTFALLEKQSNQLAHFLLDQGIKKGDVVAIYGHRSARLIWAWMGILKAGAAFVNLDPAYPVSRLQHYLDTANAQGLIQIPAAGELPSELVSFGQQAKLRLSLDQLDHFKDYPETAPVVDIVPEDTAYVAFTSGSTGLPKGVLGRHGSLSHFLPWQIERFSLSETDRFSMLSGISHDPLQRDIFTALWVGGVLCIPDPDKIGLPQYLSTWMDLQQISFAHMTPPMCQILTESTVEGTRLTHLRYVFFVGDKLTRQDVAQLQAIAPNVTAINSYGATETQRAVGYHLVPPSGQTAQLDGKAVYPLGRGMPNVQLLVLNRAQKLAGISERGEIYVRSPHISGGYLGNDQLSVERFVANPFSQIETDRMYRTGDLGRYRPDGTVEFVGRADRQFKVRGFRVEPGEIEFLLTQFPGVSDAIVLPVQGKTEWGNSLAAYFTAEDSSAVLVEELKLFVNQSLPDHMLPASFTQLDAIPLTPNGKIDYGQLPEPTIQNQKEADLKTGPLTDTETKLKDLWQELLAIERVGMHQSFFELGGHSLLAIRLFNRIHEVFEKQIPLTALFQAPSIRQLATLIDLHSANLELVTDDDKNLIRIKMGSDEKRPPLFFVHGFGGGVLGYGELARLLGEDQTVFGLQAQGHDGLDQPDHELSQMASRYIDLIKSKQPEGPYYLGGYCYGGVVAYEIARQLEQQSEDVPFVGIFEGYAPLRGGNRESILRNPNILIHWLQNLPYWYSDFVGLGRNQMLARMRRKSKRYWKRLAGTVGIKVNLRAEDVVDDTAELERHQLELMKIHLQALRNYDPDPYGGPVTLYRIQSQALSRLTDISMGWQKLAAAVDVRIIEGSHNNILEQPHVQSLAASLKTSLKGIKK
ncbi:MAG: amino acid adenylation domain-containing protein [Chloroflexota bacterium]